MKHELTLTLKPYMYSKTAKEQFQATKEYVLDILRPYKHTTVCELTENNNVHYHSLIDIEGIIQKDILLNRIRPYKPFGKPHCRQVQYEISYEKYLIKSIEQTTKVLNEHPIIADYWYIGGKPLMIGQSIKSHDALGMMSKPHRLDHGDRFSGLSSPPVTVHKSKRYFITDPSIYEDA